MAVVAQLVERRVVVADVAGSSPVDRPKEGEGSAFPFAILGYPDDNPAASQEVIAR